MVYSEYCTDIQYNALSSSMVRMAAIDPEVPRLGVELRHDHAIEK